ncbi:putative homeobox protein NANOG2 [Dipodomys merriami]|uniref:putative homeobox protein NANOG2 n=1 Tax=Dipodomys merriami TaxID=94247 RepID=UPI003855E1DD
MSVDCVCAQNAPRSEAADGEDGWPGPSSCQAHEEEPRPSPEPTLHADTVSVALRTQESPGSVSPLPARPATPDSRPGSVPGGQGDQGKPPAKRQKIRTVFSQMQLYYLNERFQKQKYLSLQQMQELSNLLNLTYKQVKTWFQNRRMKCKRWQKSRGLLDGSRPAQVGGLHPGHAPGWAGAPAAPGGLPPWSDQMCSSSSSQSWSGPAPGAHPWDPQPWNSTGPAWNHAFHNHPPQQPGQPYLPSQPDLPGASLEASMEIPGGSHPYLDAPLGLDCYVNYAASVL